ncbi:acyl-CoA thioesterase [Hyalangium rubrum]|uniref:Thioesterase family protein n=1 Tax=Hyalangium rubrum TaxID=3103134 RepID=A0ABU5GZ51_9BACT|nr:thioesterase family protein [Hyalangium sp. s54d21]MDY7225808.1 thioesterase family protein [Hyalangium sp. s54d21]
MTAPFLAATHVTPLGEGRYRTRFDAPWYQGRGAYGGVVGGQLMRALEHTVADARRPVRSFTLHFCAPAVEGEAGLQVRVERAGKLVTHATARVENASGVVAVASATFGIPRAGTPVYLDAKRPQVPAPEQVAPVPEDVPMPTFCQFFEYRFCVGAAPYSGGEPRTGGWIRPKGPALVLDAALCVGLLDAYPPSVLATMEEVRPVASVDFTVHFFHALPRPGERAGAQYLRTGYSRWASEGFAEDFQELWSEDGELIAQCRQLIAVLG